MDLPILGVLQQSLGLLVLGLGLLHFGLGLLRLCLGFPVVCSHLSSFILGFCTLILVLDLFCSLCGFCYPPDPVPEKSQKALSYIALISRPKTLSELWFPEA